MTGGFDFIALIIGLFGITEVLDQVLTYHASRVRPISSLGRWAESARDEAGCCRWRCQGCSASASASCPQPAATSPD
jgi:TctA family transporter